jgi:hypothetical protein
MYRSILAVAVVLLITPAQAQQPSSACRLLQVAEIESALGATAKKSPSGASQGGMDTCSVEMPGKRGVRVVTILIVKDLPMDSAQLIRTRNAGTAREAQWKAAGARLEQKTLGDAICITAGRPGTPGHSTCTIPRGKGYVEVDVSAPVEELVPMETVGTLVQKAAGRL